MNQPSVLRGSDTWIGLMLVLAVVAAAAFAWFGSSDRVEGPRLTAIYSDVVGLEVGDPVTLRGLEVGSVESIEPDFLESGEVEFVVAFRLLPELEAPGDSIRLSVGSAAAIIPPTLPFLGGARVTLLPDLMETQRIANGGEILGLAEPTLVETIVGLNNRIVFSIDDLSSQIGSLLDSIQTTRREADQTLRMVRREVPAIAEDLDRRMAEMSQILATADRELQMTAPAVRGLIDSLSVLTSDARGLINNIDRTVDARIPDVDALLARLDSTSFIIDNMVKKISEQPLRVLWGVDVPDSIPPRVGPGRRGGGGN